MSTDLLAHRQSFLIGKGFYCDVGPLLGALDPTTATLSLSLIRLSSLCYQLNKVRLNDPEENLAM